ncbi:hypothetical protein BDM02DRAFT_3132611 [Thelephora ganbajun]|uniref:Uncharacterized protein n=1 Tax=Thelephora ganbajun TaxID=370292 RepID=A0ACB6Z0Z3_THEGA|nr:hypothetical protein BDM02DRAFT_3132611 [Thelephora ganbajun]
MSIPIDGTPAKIKLRGMICDRRVATAPNRAEVNQTETGRFSVDALERDALQVLSHIRSMQNTFAVVNRTPAEVLALIPDYWGGGGRDKPLINLTHVLPLPALLNGLFDGDLSSLRELSLAGIITPLPWRDSILLTQLLDFFESAPFLRHIQLHGSIPSSSGAPTERVVSLPHLKDLNIMTQSVHSIPLGHLSIPAGASLRLEFSFSGAEPPDFPYLPKSPEDLCNLSYITAVNLCFSPERRLMRLNGPSGEPYVFGNRIRGGNESRSRTGRLLQSLYQFDVSRSRRLAITLDGYRPSVTSQIVAGIVDRILHSMEDLRTLMLARCNNLPFVQALNPAKNPSKVVLCPELEGIILYIEYPDQFPIDELLSMAEKRASRGAKLSAITTIGMDAPASTKEVSRLRKHVSRVKHKFYGAPPKWDAIPS